MKIIGLICIGLAVIAFVYQGITITTKKKVLDAGPIQISRDDKKNVAASADRGRYLFSGRDWVFVYGESTGLV